MILIIASALVGLGYALVRKLKGESLAAAIVVPAIIALLLVIFVSLFAPYNYQLDKKYDLGALKLNTPGLEGAFVLGTGNIKTTDEYQYLYVDPSDKTMINGFVTLRDKFIVVKLAQDQEPGQGYVDIFRREFKYEWEKFIFLFPGRTGCQIYIFHIPVGTVIFRIIIQ